MSAFNSMRMEKGYGAWKDDLFTDYSVLEAGVERWVKLDKPQDFPGKAALQAEQALGVKKRFVTMIVEAGDQDVLCTQTVYQDGKVVGETTADD